MKLGIIVVYLLTKENGPLLDIHLSQIEENTRVPYSIYASVNRLLPEFRQRLERHPRVRICECPTTELRGGVEHSYYLERLVRAAIEDGATHIATLHVDSFPVRPDWVEALASKLSPSCVMATLHRIDTGCLFFQKDYWTRFQPTFALTETEQSTTRFKQFLREFNTSVHSGTGYGYKAFLEGLTWYSLEETSKDNNRIHGIIYDDIIFHLVGANRWGAGSLNPGSFADSFAPVMAFLTRWTRTLLKPLVPSRLWYKITSPVNETWIWNQLYAQARNRLFKNPEAYLKNLRSGKPL